MNFRRRIPRIVPLVCVLFAGCDTSTKPKGPPVIGTYVGDIAKEIEGEDIDGQHLKLGDYRGKVVLLSFWGEWCVHCRALYPHERSLVAIYQGRPFVLLGVNTDEDREGVRQVAKARNITWRSWWDGSQSGPIDSAWRIRGWPTAYVIDHKGIIRHEFLGGDPGELERVIERLVREAEKEPTP